MNNNIAYEPLATQSSSLTMSSIVKVVCNVTRDSSVILYRVEATENFLMQQFLKPHNEIAHIHLHL